MKREHVTPVHPGEVLQDELEEIGLTQTSLANHIGVLPKTINEICRGKEDQRGHGYEALQGLGEARSSGSIFRITGSCVRWMRPVLRVSNLLQRIKIEDLDGEAFFGNHKV